jgi:light-regulated signal transduction histidine kinase (bacteriophytochrome)
LLIVLMQRQPLFPDDDLELLRLFSEQAAIALAQNELLNEQADLIDHLHERTAQLEAANQELEAFSYSVSHDLRAPLRHIEGFTDLLIRTNPAETVRQQHLKRISDAAVRMGRLIDSLLTFSRMGRTELRHVPVALDQLVREAQHEVGGDGQGLAVEWQIGALPEVQGDPDLLRQVFVNLLSNALKYSRTRNPARIAVGSEPGGPNECVIFVRDNGVGFEMQYSDKLFGVFQRLHHANEFEGIGIGLANVRRIVHRHGGRTWAVGALDQGATFYFALPSPVRPAAGVSPLPAVPAAAETVPPGGAPARD